MYPQFPQGPYQYPFYPQNYYPMMPPKPSLLQSMRYSMNQMNLSSTLKTAQKTLYTVNQIIPIVNQLRPVLYNATTAFRVVKAVKQFDFDDIDDQIHEVDQNVFDNMLPTQNKPN